MAVPASPILVVGVGAMGGALVAGWRRVGAFEASELILRDPAPGAQALEAKKDGARLNGPDAELAGARTVVLAVKPQLWRSAAEAIAPHLRDDAIVVSIVAGISVAAIAQAFDDRPVARVMPTLAAAVGQGTASLYSADAPARERARALFAPLGEVVELADEALMHAATAVSGSAPAYFYAFVEALEAAGADAGLAPSIAARLARSSLTGAAALLAGSDETPAALRAAVTSPGGVTEAALDVLTGQGRLGPLMVRAARAGVARSKRLGA